MASAESSEPVSPGLCSERSARLGLPLIGSAGSYDAILAFELPSPWTPKLVGSRAGTAALDSAIERIGREAKRVRLLAIEGEHSGDGDRRLLGFFRESGGFRRFARRALRVAPGELAQALEALVFDSGKMEAAGESPDESAGLRDLLVCTHGARDVCCGKFGYPLYRRLLELAGPALGVWRCSHLGGHRFAPTLLDLPSGRLFGRVAVEDAATIVSGGAPLAARAEAIYRGRSSLPEAAQIVERALWMRLGARLDDATLAWKVEREGDSHRVRVEALLPEGEGDHERAACEALVTRSQAAAVETPASCGRDPEMEAPWSMTELRDEAGLHSPP